MAHARVDRACMADHAWLGQSNAHTHGLTTIVTCGYACASGMLRPNMQALHPFGKGDELAVLGI